MSDVATVASAAPAVDMTVYILIIGVIAALVFVAIKFGRGKAGEFKAKQFNKTITGAIECMSRDNGENVKGRLFLGHYEIGKVKSYLALKGSFTVMRYDANRRKMLIAKEKTTIGEITKVQNIQEPYDQILLKVHPRSFVKKIINYVLGKSWRYYLVDREHIEHFDVVGKIWQLIPGLTFYYYGGIAVSGEQPQELLNTISVLAGNESIMTHAQNMADRIIFLEAQTARRVAVAKSDADAQKSRWESAKEYQDTKTTAM